MSKLATVLGGARVLVPALAAGLSACAINQPFHPVEKATGESPQGDLAADYDIRIEGGEDIGEARVWTSGALKPSLGEDTSIVNVGFIVENESDSPMTFEGRNLSLEFTTNENLTYKNVRPMEDPGAVVIPSGERRRIDVAFRLPQVQQPDLDPDDVVSFRVKWQIDNKDGSFREGTSFRQTQPVYAPAGYYDSYWYPSIYRPAYDPYWGYPGWW